ncbi:hypothetical protein PHLCEN_2v12441, partial [Hermanssonia centrifuga]
PPVNYLDGLVGATSPEKRYIITSPNVEFVPLPIWGKIELRMRADGRFGIHDPINCPQTFLYKHGHLAAILREPDNVKDPIACMWQTPRPCDFVPLDGMSSAAFGTLAPTTLQPISACIRKLSDDVRRYLKHHPETQYLPALLLAMQNCYARLEFPSTFRDLIRQVASVQRTWLECRALWDWVGTFIPLLDNHSGAKPAPVKVNRMGAFTMDPAVVQNLMAIGLPVWFIRRTDQLPGSTVIKKIVPAAHAAYTTAIEMGFGPYPGQAVYSGYAGTEQHYLALWRTAFRMLDIEHTLIVDAFIEEEERTAGRPAASSSSLPSSTPGAVRAKHSHVNNCPYERPPATKSSATKAPKIRGMNKFLVIQHDRIPQAVNVWATALAKVNRAKTPANNWGYWLPEPHMLVGPDGINRARNYLRNWFWVREGWLYMLANRATRFDPLPSKLWRDWLQHEPEKVKEYKADNARLRRKTYVLNLFTANLPNELSQEEPGKDTIFWNNQRVESPPSVAIYREIAWEVLEIAFRVELLELDRYLVPIDTNDMVGAEFFRQEKIAKVFSDGQLMRPVRLPTSSRGLAATHIEDRRDSIQALHQLVLRWPEVPRAIVDSNTVPNMNTAALQSLEIALATYYVQKFYEVSGRAATIPYHFPTILRS